MSRESGSEDLLDLLGEERVRQILAATSREALSAKELSEEFDVARSTIYRRVEEMIDRDLLVERTQLAADGSHHSVYEANVDHLDIVIEDGHIEIGVHRREDAAERFARLWTEIRET